MPHSNFEEKLRSFNSVIMRCHCGQTFSFSSERDMNMKLQMHHKFCLNSPERYKQMQRTKKFMTIREQQHYEAEMMSKLHDHH